MAFQISCRTSSLARTARIVTGAAGRSAPPPGDDWQNRRPMAERARTSLRPEVGEPTETNGRNLPVPHGDDLRRYLPGVEPERRLTDWGRSERIEDLFDSTLGNFFYRYWFRCEVEGIENVPATGGAMLVSNHSGALPPDAAMIGKAVKEEHPHPRPVNITVEHFFKGYPGFSMLIPKLGCVAAHPANVHRLLYDEEQLVLVFPEGRKGTEKLYKNRYRLGGFAAAASVGRACGGGRRSVRVSWLGRRRRRRSSRTSVRCRSSPG